MWLLGSVGLSSSEEVAGQAGPVRSRDRGGEGMSFIKGGVGGHGPDGSIGGEQGSWGRCAPEEAEWKPPFGEGSWRSPGPDLSPLLVPRPHFPFQVHCISTEFTPRKHGGEKGVPFRVQIDTFKQNENGEYTEHLHSASCQIKVFKVGQRCPWGPRLCWTVMAAH